VYVGVCGIESTTSRGRDGGGTNNNYEASKIPIPRSRSASLTGRPDSSSNSSRSQRPPDANQRLTYSDAAIMSTTLLSTASRTGAENRG